MAALTQTPHTVSQPSQIDDLIIWEELERAFQRLSIQDDCESGESDTLDSPSAAVKPQLETRNEPQSYHIEDIALDAKKPELRGRASSMPPPTIRIIPPPMDPHEDECLSS